MISEDVGSKGATVSRETLARFDIYLRLLRKWSKTVNLVAPNTLDAAEERHFADSLQLLDLIPTQCRRLADLGSGGGFPGMVLAIALAERGEKTIVHLIEADQRKAAFLRAVARETDVLVQIHSARIEATAPLRADIVTARALAPLRSLLPLVQRHLLPSGRALLMKGARFTSEVAEARGSWRFSCSTTPSKTQPGAAILGIGGLHHV